MKGASKRKVLRRLLAGICTSGAAIVEPVSAQVSFAETQIAIVNDGLGTVLTKTCDATNLRKAPHSGHEQESGTIFVSNGANDNVRWTDQNCRGIVPRESYTLGGYLFSIASAPEAVSEAADPSGNRMQTLVAAPTTEGSPPPVHG